MIIRQYYQILGRNLEVSAFVVVIMYLACILLSWVRGLSAILQCWLPTLSGMHFVFLGSALPIYTTMFVR